MILVKTAEGLTRPRLILDSTDNYACDHMATMADILPVLYIYAFQKNIYIYIYMKNIIRQISTF